MFSVKAFLKTSIQSASNDLVDVAQVGQFKEIVMYKNL